MKQINKGRIFMIMAIVFTVLCAVALVWFAINLIGKRQAACEFNQPGISGTVAVGTDKEGITLETGEKKVIDWQYWQSINSDIVGWLYIPDTGIDYPVVQANRLAPRYYLDHDIYGNYNDYGVPYIDSECTTKSNLVVISGHNMGFDNKAMFSELAQYSDIGFLSAHKDVYFLTPEKTIKLSVRAAEVTLGSAPTKQTGDSRELMKVWYAERFEAAQTKLANPDNEQLRQVVTLSTCSYKFWPKNERTLVYCVDSVILPDSANKLTTDILES